jgi:proteasome lid subunit RPN8/RPN11
LDIPRKFWDAMLEHAGEEDPNECCGILAIKDGVVTGHHRIVNVERSPYRYKMDPLYFKVVDEVEDDGASPAFYHSHTHSPAYPSQTDIRLVVYPDSYYLIVSSQEFDGNSQKVSETPQVRAFAINGDKITEESVVVTDQVDERRKVREGRVVSDHMDKTVAPAPRRRGPTRAAVRAAARRAEEAGTSAPPKAKAKAAKGESEHEVTESVSAEVENVSVATPETTSLIISGLSLRKPPSA